MYTYQHQGGLFYLYVNNTADSQLTEKLKFTLKGLEIDGQEDQENVEVVVSPGEQKHVRLNAIASAMSLGKSTQREIQEV